MKKKRIYAIIKPVRGFAARYWWRDFGMYQIGDQVVYGMHGVCRVVDEEKRVVDRKTVTYLALEPVGQNGSRFLVPTHNAAAMAKIRNMLTREELDAMLCSDAVRADGWIKEENLRKQTYRELIGSGDRVRLMQMVRTLHIHKTAQAAAGKKVHLCDDNFLRDAEKLLISEASIVLNMDSDQAKQYLRSKLKEES